MLNADDAILLVEDDRVDIMTVQRALKKNQIGNPLHIARTGQDALDMLRGEHGQENQDTNLNQYHVETGHFVPIQASFSCGLAVSMPENTAKSAKGLPTNGKNSSSFI